MADPSQPQAIPFADSAASLATDHDVMMCYQLLLGRSPENSHVVQEAKTQRVDSIFKAFVRSSEFADRVRLPFDQGQPLAQDAESLGPSDEQLAWLTKQLRLTRRATSAVSAARSWRALFSVMFGLPGFTPAAQPVPAILFGAIDSFTGSLVRGWCIDAAEPGRPASLAMLADGRIVGHCDCQLLRPDVQAALGGDARCGFEFEIPEEICARPIMLSAQNFENEAVVFGPVYITPSSTVFAGRVAALQEQLVRLDGLVQEVAGALPPLAAELDYMAHLSSGPPQEPEAV